MLTILSNVYVLTSHSWVVQRWQRHATQHNYSKHVSEVEPILVSCWPTISDGGRTLVSNIWFVRKWKFIMQDTVWQWWLTIQYMTVVTDSLVNHAGPTAMITVTTKWTGECLGLGERRRRCKNNKPLLGHHIAVSQQTRGIDPMLF